MIVVPVLMTSCQVSEKLKSGPVTNQTATTATAPAKAQLLPAYFVAFSASRSSDLWIRAAMQGRRRGRIVLMHDANQFGKGLILH